MKIVHSGFISEVKWLMDGCEMIDGWLWLFVQVLSDRPLFIPPGSEGLVNSQGVDCVMDLLYILIWHCL